MAKKKVTKKKKTPKKKATKKKKTTKKAATKHTKPVKKKIVKKKPKKEKIDSMEQLYKLIHSVQVLKKHASLTIEDISIKPIILNILKDSGVEYQENVFDNKILIRLIPNEETFDDDIDLEEVDKDFIFDITSL